METLATGTAVNIGQDEVRPRVIDRSQELEEHRTVLDLNTSGGDLMRALIASSANSDRDIVYSRDATPNRQTTGPSTGPSVENDPQVHEEAASILEAHRERMRKIDKTFAFIYGGMAAAEAGYMAFGIATGEPFRIALGAVAGLYFGWRSYSCAKKASNNAESEK